MIRRGSPDLAQVHVAGDVLRWHSNPALCRLGQTNADHVGRCAQILLCLNPTASPALIRNVLFHDLGERWVGDVPGPAKDSHPDLRALLDKIEGKAIAQVLGAPLPVLLPEEAAWLRLVDRLEALATVVRRAPDEAGRIGAGWLDARAEVLRRAEELGVRDAVHAMIRNLESGEW